MTTWVEEFHDFAGNNNNNNKFGSITTGGGMKSTFVPRKPSRKETLEAELKLLEWHKLANDAALKAALMQTKQLRDPSPKRDPSLDEDAKRIRKIITNEQTKPLEVSKDFVLKYQQKEVADSEKLANQVEKHIQTLRDIRGKLEERIELKSRINEYRDWKKGFHEKKMAIMSGQTLHNFTESHSLNSKQIGGTTSVNGPNGTGPSGSAGGSRDLAVVLDSLNKLSQLEARITTLERDNENMYEKLKKNEETSQLEAERTALEFKKKRAIDPLQKGAMKTVYALKTKKVPISKGVKINKGTFLTAVERDTNNLRDARYREKQRQLALATSGQKNLRERVRVKKTRQLENINSHRKHEEALQELSKRRTEQNQRMKEKRTNVIQGIGASSGRKFKNKYLEDFQKIKNEHRNKREKSYSTRGGDKEYLSSMTAPSSSIVPKRPPPTTKTAGTVTRRVNTIPIKNRERDHSQERESSLKMPPIVGSGVGGVRALKEMKKGGK